MDSSASFICTWRFGRVGSLWVDLAGELDRSHCPELERVLEEAPALSRLVVLDMREVTFMHAAAAQIVADAGIRTRRAGRGLIVARGPIQVDEVFTLTGTAEQVKLSTWTASYAHRLTASAHTHRDQHADHPGGPGKIPRLAHRQEPDGEVALI